MKSAETILPRWNLDSIYTGFSDPRYIEDIESIGRDILAFKTLAGDTGAASDNTKTWSAKCIALLNGIIEKAENIESYAYCRYTTATTDRDALGQINRIEELLVPLPAARTLFRNTLAGSVKSCEDLCGPGSPLADYDFFIREELEYQRRQMTAAEEDLASDLSRSGANAWGRLQETMSSVESSVWDEKTGERKTIIQLRALAYDADRLVREKAYHRELEAWDRIRIPMAYALNGVKGHSIVVNDRRGYRDTLERSIMQSRITPEALEAMIEVMKESLPVFRQYLKKKASLLGTRALAFFDLFAPLGKNNTSWNFSTTRDFILTQFHSFSDEYGAFGEQAFRGDWIDAEPREGKVGGAYCTSFSKPWESRILCNFDNSFNSVTTIAHELGHAYHHAVLTGIPCLLRNYPMTLAETASIFSENIIYGKLLAELEDDARLPVLETFLQDSCQVIVDILSRFLFEQAVFEKRTSGDLAPEELCDFMTDAQKQTYGDGLDPDLLHPYMWAVKGHYYSHDLAFYNFPYAFGLLFGLSLYGLYREEGSAFAGRYVSLLRNTGKMSAVDVASQAGFHIEEHQFWRSGIRVISERAEEFAHLADAGRSNGKP